MKWWRNQNISGRKRTSTHGIVRIPTTTTSNVNITGQLGVADTVLPFFSEIRGVNGITFKGTSTIENSEGLTDGVLRIEGGNNSDTSTFSIQLENGIKINGPFYQTAGSSQYNVNDSGETLTGKVERITKTSYKICCKPGKVSGEKGSLYMVPIDDVKLN